MRKWISLLLVCMMVLALFTGCSSSNDTPNHPDPTPSATTPVESTPPLEEVSAPYGTLHRYTTTELTNINPFESSESASEDVITGTSMRLYIQVPNETGDGAVWVPELAADEPVKLNDDGTRWEIPIRQGCAWSDGTPITANDFVYTAKSCMDPLLLTRRASSFASNYITIANAEAYYLQNTEGNPAVDWTDVGLQAKDDYTLSLTLAEFATASDIKNHFSNKYCALVKESVFESCMSTDRTTNTYGTSLDTWASCGRFIMTDFQPGKYFAFVRNENHPLADRIHVEGWDYTVVADSNTALELFLNGELDTATLNSSTREQYEDDPRVRTSPSDTVECMVINIGNTSQNGIYQNVNFRKALFYGIDRVSLAKITKGIPANYILGQKCTSNSDTGENYRALANSSAYLGPNYSYDPEKAKSYFDTALSECGLTEVTVTMLYSESSNVTKSIVEYLSSTLPSVFGGNFHVALDAQSSSVAKQMRKNWVDGDPNTYEITFSGWSTSATAPWNAMKVYCGWYSGKNEPYYNDEFDALWDEANNSRKAKEDNAYRVELTQQMEKMLLDDAITIPLYESPTYQLFSDRVHLVVDEYIQGLGNAIFYASIVEE